MSEESALPINEKLSPHPIDEKSPQVTSPTTPADHPQEQNGLFGKIKKVLGARNMTSGEDKDKDPKKTIVNVFKYLVILGLIIAAFVYLASRVDKFNKQTVLVQVQSEYIANEIAFPRMAFCINPAYSQPNISMHFYSNVTIDCKTTKQINPSLTIATNMQESTTSEGLHCWIIDSPDPIVRQRLSRREDCPAPPALILMSSLTQFTLPTVLYYAFLPPTASLEDTNFIWWQIPSLGSYIVSYDVEHRIVIPQSGSAYQSARSYFGQSNDQNVTIFNSPNMVFGGFQYLTGTFSIAIFPDFTVRRTQEYYDYPASNILTDFITFITSVALAIYVFLFNSKPANRENSKKWGLVHHVLNVKPFNEEHYNLVQRFPFIEKVPIVNKIPFVVKRSSSKTSSSPV